jgi:hypothetical protein
MGVPLVEGVRSACPLPPVRNVCRERAAGRRAAYAQRPVRFVFTAYLVLIGLGLAFYIAIGIANHQ